MQTNLNVAAACTVCQREGEVVFVAWENALHEINDSRHIAHRQRGHTSTARCCHDGDLKEHNNLEKTHDGEGPPRLVLLATRFVLPGGVRLAWYCFYS